MAETERRKDAETRELLDRVAHSSGKAGGREALMEFMSHVTPHDPNTAEGMLELRADLTHLNKSRKFKESMRAHIWRVGLGAAILAGLTALWSGLKNKVGL